MVGWAASEKEHLRKLPELLALGLGVEGAQLRVAHWNGSVVHEHTYPLPPANNTAPMHLAPTGDAQFCEFSRPLGNEWTLNLSIHSREEGLTTVQVAAFHQIAAMIHSALECVLVKQEDNRQIGGKFSDFSAREWDVCRRLEGPEGEKQIADTMMCSPHTLHSYVKGVYRKLHVQSRLEVIHSLKTARHEIRKQHVDSFTATGAAGPWTVGEDHSTLEVRVSA
jgi:DNA-binding CsgD family transcriptional regulator